MTDAHLRQLERDAAQGDLEAQTRLLLERVRICDLSLERLRLAAYLGDGASREALGDQAPRQPLTPFTLAKGLSDWGEDLCIETSMVLAELIEEDARRVAREMDTPRRPVYQAGIAFLASPSMETALHVTSLWAAMRFLFLRDESRPVYVLVLAARAWLGHEPAESVGHAAREAAKILGEEEVRAEIRSRLVPEILGGAA